MSGHRWIALVAVGMLLAVGLGTAPAVADTQESTWGPVGRHQLIDRQAAPGASCRFGAEWDLEQMGIRPPTVFARDRTAGRDRQRVAWQVVVKVFEGYYPEPHSSVVARSRLMRATAWDDSPADFSPVTLDVSSAKGYHLWATVTMSWYRPGTTDVVARSRHRVDWYALPGAVNAWRGGCPTEVL